LRQNLGNWAQVEEDKDLEHFGLFWPGKRDARRIAALPPQGTLEPVFGEGLKANGKSDKDGINDSKNIFIEGENLEVLKILQKSYAGKIKMIYIDPPYNTGNDFVYDDDFAEPLQEYLRRTGQVDEEGKPLTTNKRSDGRFHSKWLSMMYPRLRLARNLLTEEGAIFISIDDNEVNNLRSILNEIFGEENFVSQLTLLNNPKGRALDKYFSTCHEYILVYSKNILQNGAFSVSKSDAEIEEDYPLSDDKGVYRELELRNTHREFGKHNRKNLYYPIYVHPKKLSISLSEENGLVPVYPNWEDGYAGCWTWGKDKSKNEIELLTAKLVNGAFKIYRKSYGKSATKQIKTVLLEKEYQTEKGQKAFSDLFDSKEKLFQSPKSVELLKMLIQTIASRGDIVLDFFAGSGSFAQACDELTDLSLSFVCVQLPEAIQDDEPAFKAGYSSISQLTMDRIRKYQSNHTKAKGVRLLRLKHSNYAEWFNVSESSLNGLERNLDLFNQNPLKEGWTKDGFIYEIILSEGFVLSSTLEKVAEYKKNEVIKVSDEYCEHSLLVCLDKEIKTETIKSLELSDNDIFICLDSAISNVDKLKLSDRGLIKTI
jgi:adenine-specific DNA-methyltransferase